MFIIVEGPDGSGKTTAIQMLTHELWKRGRGTVLVNIKRSPHQPALVEYVERLDWYQPESGVDLILDRSFYSEDIYGPIWRGEGHPPGILEACEAWALRKGAIVVRLDESDKTLIKRVTADIKNDPDAAHMSKDLVVQYAKKYRQVAPGWNLPTVTFPPGYDFYPDPAINHAEAYSRLAKEAQ